MGRVQNVSRILSVEGVVKEQYYVILLYDDQLEVI